MICLCLKIPLVCPSHFPGQILSLLLLLLLFYFTLWEFFISANADGFPLEFEWQQISSSLQDSSQYSGWSQQCSSLDSLHPSRYFQVLLSLYQSFGDLPRAPITIAIIVTFMFHCFFFNSRARSRYLSLFIHSFNFTLWSAGTTKSTILQVLSFCWLL